MSRNAVLRCQHTCLGDVVSGKEEVKVDPAKIDAVMPYIFQRSPGLVGWYHKFIPRLEISFFFSQCKCSSFTSRRPLIYEVIWGTVQCIRVHLLNIFGVALFSVLLSVDGLVLFHPPISSVSAYRLKRKHL